MNVSVIARFRALHLTLFYAAISFMAVGAVLFGFQHLENVASIQDLGDILIFVVAMLCSAYTLFYISIGLINLLFLGGRALYVRKRRLVYVSPLICNIKFEDIKNVEVDHSRESRGLKATVRIERSQGRARYIRTEFLDRTATTIRDELQHVISQDG